VNIDKLLSIAVDEGFHAVPVLLRVVVRRKPPKTPTTLARARRHGARE